MATKFEAAKSIRILANLYRDMADAADALEQIGSVEQAVAESNGRLASVRGEIEQAEAKLVELKDAEAKQQAFMADAAQSHRELLEGNRAEIIKKAEEDAAEILKNAQDKAAEMVAQGSMEKARLSSEIGGIQRAIEAGKAELASIVEAKGAKEAELAEVQGKLDALKSKLRSFVE